MVIWQYSNLSKWSLKVLQLKKKNKTAQKVFFFLSINCKTKTDSCVTADRTTATLNFCAAETERRQAELIVISEFIVAIIYKVLLSCSCLLLWGPVLKRVSMLSCRPAAVAKRWIKGRGSWRSSWETGSRRARSWWLRWSRAKRRAGSTPANSSSSRQPTKSLWSSWRPCAERTRLIRVRRWDHNRQYVDGIDFYFQ